MAGAQAGRNAVENNALSGLEGFGKGMMDYGQAQTSLGGSMIKNGTSPDEIAAALSKAAKGDMPEGQNAAEGLLVAWGNFFSVPLDVVMSNEQMTPQKAAEILSSGLPTSEKKLLQYVAAKAFFSVAKSSDLGLSASNQKYVDILSPE
ncbi:VENN motif pre-toxin domain-containing protein [Pantoea sp. RIT413]|uniref:VENN motif pre-toxin domain-containing protein n=1 Tax=Pantoea sp. RIT413 TaxID=2202162 RepID=UPI001F31F3EE|nr:VENN motif pre-toxin domain-containing protein [Pantoea sp. RIT 413]